MASHAETAPFPRTNYDLPIKHKLAGWVLLAAGVLPGVLYFHWMLRSRQQAWLRAVEAAEAEPVAMVAAPYASSRRERRDMARQGGLVR